MSLESFFVREERPSGETAEDSKTAPPAPPPKKNLHLKENTKSSSLERYPGEGNGNPLQYSYLGNPMDRGAWWATVHGVTKESDTP